MQPMLATAADALPAGPGWAYEFKWDGVRALLDVTAERVQVNSRLGNDVTAAYPELAALGAGLDDALVDGEIVALQKGRPSFERLQTRMHVRSKAHATRLAADTPVTFIAFDLLRLYGVEMAGRTLVERRATLDRLTQDRTRWTVSPIFDDGPAVEAAARENGLEGVVAKRLASTYRPGVRSADWVKVKFVRRGELVVVGWEADATTPETLSSLLLGYYDDGELTFAGKVGSGLTGATATRLRAELTGRAGTPLRELPPPSPGRRVRWVEPSTVVEVSYTRWTEDGRLRHPVFLGVRTDKHPREVGRDG